MMGKDFHQFFMRSVLGNGYWLAIRGPEIQTTRRQILDVLVVDCWQFLLEYDLGWQKVASRTFITADRLWLV